jgi:ribonuclease HII
MAGLSPKQELNILNEGIYSRIVGIDEVGRGCWAGPVAVGAYIFTAQQPRLRGVMDSKVLVLPKREKVYQRLSQHEYRVSYGSVEEIDSKGISKVIESLIANFVEEFHDGQTLFLIDGQFRRNFGSHSRKIIDGDAHYYSIAAASILAKVERDNLMVELSNQFPNYGLHKHKGYGTKEHQHAIDQFGICDIHRRSWQPINLRLTPQLQFDIP